MYCCVLCAKKRGLKISQSNVILYTATHIANVEHLTIIFLLYPRHARDETNKNKRRKNARYEEKELSSLLCVHSVHAVCTFNSHNMTRFECLHKLATILFSHSHSMSLDYKAYNFRSASCRELKFKLKKKRNKSALFKFDPYQSGRLNNRKRACFQFNMNEGKRIECTNERTPSGFVCLNSIDFC